MLIFPGALGDVLLALPALRDVRTRSASAGCTVVVADRLGPLMRLAGLGDRVEHLEGASTAWLFGGSRMPSWLVDRPVVYSWIGSTDREVGERLAAVAREAHVFAVVRDRPAPVRSAGGPPAALEHAAAAYARQVGMADVALEQLERAARIVPAPSASAAAVLGVARGPVLVVHRGAGAPAKCWPAERFAAVATAWRRRGGVVVDVAGPAEAHHPELEAAIPVRDWPLPDLSALLAASAAYVGNDSGVSHLAGAVGARGAVVFGPTDPRRWRPLSPALVPLRERDGAPVAVGRVLEVVLAVANLTSRKPDTIDRA